MRHIICRSFVAELLYFIFKNTLSFELMWVVDYNETYAAQSIITQPIIILVVHLYYTVNNAFNYCHRDKAQRFLKYNKLRTMHANWCMWRAWRLSINGRRDLDLETAQGLFYLETEEIFTLSVTVHICIRMCSRLKMPCMRIAYENIIFWCSFDLVACMHITYTIAR